MAVKLDPWQKALALVLMFLTFAFGSYLAYKNYNGVGTAAVFAVALILLIVGFGGVLPTNVKVGDVEVAIQQARQEGASAVASVPDAPDSKAAAQQVKQAHPELAPQVDRMQDAMQEARKEGASVVASVPLAPDPKAAAQQVKQEHPELAREAAIVAVATISDPDKFQEAAQAGILREEMADLDPANVEPITGTV